MLQTREEIQALTLKQAEQQLKKLERTFQVDKPFQDNTTPELWNQLDDIANNLLWLEDRIANLKMMDNLAKANEARWANKDLTPEEE
jgi:hypothetical protein